VAQIPPPHCALLGGRPLWWRGRGGGEVVGEGGILSAEGLGA
jgi:hypothetical protein